MIESIGRGARIRTAGLLRPRQGYKKHLVDSARFLSVQCHDLAPYSARIAPLLLPLRTETLKGLMPFAFKFLPSERS